MRLESEHATGDAAVARLVAQQGQHRLVAAVHAVEIADRESARPRNLGVVEAAQDQHRKWYLFCSRRRPLDGANVPMACHGRIVKSLYIVSHAGGAQAPCGAVGLFVVEWRRV